MWWGQHMFDLGWSGWLFGGLMMLLFWGGLIALLFFAIRAFSRPGNQSRQTGTGESVLDILKKRYARGEISKTEYDEMRQHLDT